CCKTTWKPSYHRSDGRRGSCAYSLPFGQCIINLIGPHGCLPRIHPGHVVQKYWPFLQRFLHHAPTQVTCRQQICCSEMAATNVGLVFQRRLQRTQGVRELAATDGAGIVSVNLPTEGLSGGGHFHRARNEEHPAVVSA